MRHITSVSHSTPFSARIGATLGVVVAFLAPPALPPLEVPMQLIRNTLHAIYLLRICASLGWRVCITTRKPTGSTRCKESGSLYFREFCYDWPQD